MALKNVFNVAQCIGHTLVLSNVQNVNGSSQLEETGFYFGFIVIG